MHHLLAALGRPLPSLRSNRLGYEVSGTVTDEDTELPPARTHTHDLIEVLILRVNANR